MSLPVGNRQIVPWFDRLVLTVTNSPRGELAEQSGI